MENSIFVIKPYNYLGTWVFDDASVGLVKEPFVFGIPVIIEKFTSHLPDAKNGFTVLFSANEMPENDLILENENEMSGGNWYKVSGIELRGWLCPALFKYFKVAPGELLRP